MLQQDSVLFHEIKFEISEVFEFSILGLILKSKTQKTRKFLKACNWFVGGVGDFRGFWVSDFGPYTEIENSEKTSKFEWISFIWRNWEFAIFINLFYLFNLSLKITNKQNISYNIPAKKVAAVRKIPRFASFQFWPLCWNGKLGKLGIFFQDL